MIRTALFVLLFLCPWILGAQTLDQEEVLNTSLEQFEYKKQTKRSVLSFKERSFWYKINPLSYVSIGLMFTYQRGISPQLGSSCGYHNSCSEHAKLCVQEYGLFKGVFLGFYQFQSCTSKAGYDYPDFRINEDGAIINPPIWEE